MVSGLPSTCVVMPFWVDTGSLDFRINCRSLDGRGGLRMCQFDDRLEVSPVGDSIRFVSYFGVRLRSALRRAGQNSAPAPPTACRLCSIARPIFDKRPRVDGILIDEMSFWDKPRQVMIEFSDTARVGLSKEGLMKLSRNATTLSQPRARQRERERVLTPPWVSGTNQR
mgnify:CR=1 FL=1